MALEGFLIFKNGHWEDAAEDAAEKDRTRFWDMKFYRANLIDYGRIVLCTIAYWTMSTQPLLTAALVYISTLLDWVDGPVARAYGECSIFGSGIDWAADIQAQLVVAVWWAQLQPSVAPWLLLATTIEIITCVFDYATTATNRYPKPGKQRGFFKILDWAMPGGSYTNFGTFLWLAYPTYCLACVLDISWPTRGAALNTTLLTLEYTLLLPSILYIWCEAAYGLFIILAWTEAPRNGVLIGKSAPACGGMTVLPQLPKDKQTLLSSVEHSARAHMGTQWRDACDRRETFWVNLWQKSAEPIDIDLPAHAELESWVQATVLDVFGKNTVLDGYGLIINPVGSAGQDFHIDYTRDYASIFIPLSTLTPHNATQFVVMPPHTTQEAINRATPDLDCVKLEDIQREVAWASVQQTLAPVMTPIVMHAGTVHRAVANTGADERVMFWISVRDAGTPMLKPEPWIARIDLNAAVAVGPREPSATPASASSCSLSPTNNSPADIALGSTGGTPLKLD